MFAPTGLLVYWALVTLDVVHLVPGSPMGNPLQRASENYTKPANHPRVTCGSSTGQKCPRIAVGLLWVVHTSPRDTPGPALGRPWVTRKSI